MASDYCFVRLGNRHLSSSCNCTQSLGNRETLDGCKLITERQKREVTSLVTCRLFKNLGGTSGVWPMVTGSVRQGRPSPNTFLAISMKWGPISKENEDEVERVRSLLSETEREYQHLVTPKNLLESKLLQGRIDKGGHDH
ncbi:unnamed protein product [Prunus armeniaca]